jgi:hypothetical protein
MFWLICLVPWLGSLNGLAIRDDQPSSSHQMTQRISQQIYANASEHLRTLGFYDPEPYQHLQSLSEQSHPAIHSILDSNLQSFLASSVATAPNKCMDPVALQSKADAFAKKTSKEIQQALLKQYSRENTENRLSSLSKR